MSIAQSLIGASPGLFWAGTGVALVINTGLFYWIFRSVNKTRLMEDLPTSKIRSAAQGYVELEGTAQLMPGEPIRAPLSGAECTWFQYKIEKRESSRFNRNDTETWRTLEEGISDSIFHLEDDTGVCVVDPDGAEISPSINLRWHGRAHKPNSAPPVPSTGWWSLLATGRYRYTEKRIQPGDQLYATGHFNTLGDFDTNTTQDDDVRDLLATWKCDGKTLLERFDFNRNGQIDVREWEIARKQAKKEAQLNQTKRTTDPGSHILNNPGKRHQPFILSTISQDRLIRKHRLYAGLYTFGFLTSGAMLVWALNLRLS